MSTESEPKTWFTPNGFRNPGNIRAAVTYIQKYFELFWHKQQQEPDNMIKYYWIDKIKIK